MAARAATGPTRFPTPLYLPQATTWGSTSVHSGRPLVLFDGNAMRSQSGRMVPAVGELGRPVGRFVVILRRARQIRQPERPAATHGIRRDLDQPIELRERGPIELNRGLLAPDRNCLVQVQCPTSK